MARLRNAKLAALSRACREAASANRAARKASGYPQRDDVTFAPCGNSFHAATVSTRLQDYDYALPRELIAQRPLPGRGQARMMILRRVGQTIEHGRFLDLPQLLSPGDIVVLNDSRVLPARHFSDDEKFEFLFLRKLSANRWQALVRPAKKFARGACTRIKGMQVEAGDALARRLRLPTKGNE